MIWFFVPGIPAPQGSKRHVGGGRMVESSKRLPGWRSDVAWRATQAMSGQQAIPRGVAVRVDLRFNFTRPRGHYGTGRNADRLKPTAPQHHTVKPDVDKLERAILDALTGVVWHDDSQVVCVTKWKVYDDRQPGASIAITPIDQEAAA